MSSFVRNLILDKIYDEITKEDEKRILKRQEKSKLEKNKFSWRYVSKIKIIVKSKNCKEKKLDNSSKFLYNHSTLEIIDFRVNK